MPTQLVVTAGPDAGRVFPLTVGAPVSIGRGAQSNTRLVDLAVSRLHCEVQFSEGRATITDVKSASGTFVNGERITSFVLQPGDVIQIGDTKIRFEHDVAEDATIPPVDAPTKSPGTNVVIASKPGGRVLPKPLKDLCDLAGKSLGSYQLLSVLGVGQIGVVFHARDTRDQKALALKVMRADFAKDLKAKQRFIRGMMTVRTLTHPNLIELYNAGMTDGHCWIAMELVDGRSLADIIQAMPRSAPRDWKLVVHVAANIATALGFMHQQGMIHRSVMPQNIQLQKDDKLAKLGDAMLAKALEESTDQDVTAAGELVGNLFYMAPERTMKDADVDGRADLYSLGVTLYYFSTGRMPYEGTSMPEIVTKIRQQTPERAKKHQPSMPDLLDAILAKLLAKKPEERYPGAKELLGDLARVKV